MACHVHLKAAVDAGWACWVKFSGEGGFGGHRWMYWVVFWTSFHPVLNNRKANITKIHSTLSHVYCSFTQTLVLEENTSAWALGLRFVDRPLHWTLGMWWCFPVTAMLSYHGGLVTGDWGHRDITSSSGIWISVVLCLTIFCLKSSSRMAGRTFCGFLPFSGWSCMKLWLYLLFYILHIFEAYHHVEWGKNLNIWED